MTETCISNISDCNVIYMYVCVCTCMHAGGLTITRAELKEESIHVQ